jgi:hypothetical protein
MVLILISKPKPFDLWIVLETSGALRGVVTMVAFTPREANSFAMSMVGIMWPCAMKGKKKMCT